MQPREAACPIGRPCSSDDDCETEHCSDQVCVSPDCTDGDQNNAETDVDCGGPECLPCQTGETCLSPSDCQSGVCVEQVCLVSLCGDGDVDGPESCDTSGESASCDDDCTLAVCGDLLINPEAGEIFSQPDLAATLRKLVEASQKAKSSEEHIADLSERTQALRGYL